MEKVTIQNNKTGNSGKIKETIALEMNMATSAIKKERCKSTEESTAIYAVPAFK